MSSHDFCTKFIATWLALNPSREELLKVLIDISEVTPLTVKSAIQRVELFNPRVERYED